MAIVIPTQLRPDDGRFGAGPSKIREAQLDTLWRDRHLLSTSHRQPDVKNLVGRIRAQIAELIALPADYEVVLGNGGATTFWDRVAFKLIVERSHDQVFGQFGRSFAAAARTPWLAEPDIREAAPGQAVMPKIVDGIDAYAWPQNETSTGVCMPVRKVAAEHALTLIDATSSAGAIAFNPRQCDAYYFAPQKNLGSDGGQWIAALACGDPACCHDQVNRTLHSGFSGSRTGH